MHTLSVPIFLYLQSLQKRSHKLTGSLLYLYLKVTQINHMCVNRLVVFAFLNLWYSGFVDRCLSFCSFFLLPPPVLSVLLRFTATGYPFGISDLRLLVTPLVS